MVEIRNMLDKEIETELEGLTVLEDGSDEKLKAIEGIERLHKLRIAEEELDNKTYEFIQERNKNEQEVKERALDRKIKTGLEIGSIVLPMLVSSIWLKKGFKFEETGVITSSSMRGLFNKVFKNLK